MTDSTSLIAQTIADLEALASDLGGELEADRYAPKKSARHLRTKEALLTISILLPKLAVVKSLGDDDESELRETPQ